MNNSISITTCYFKRAFFKKERRAHPRYKTSLRARYSAPAEEGVSWIRDISKGGLGLFLGKTFDLKTPLRIEINLPYDSQPIFFRGSVVWSRSDYAGLSFDEASQDDLKRVLHYIYNKQQISLA